MKKLLLIAIILLTQAAALAGPQDASNIRISQNLDQTPSTGITVRYLAVPVTSSATCAVVLSGSTRLPHCYTLGAGFSIVNDVISAGQTQADWSATTGPAAILNKPAFSTIAYTGDWADLLNKPSTWAPSPHTHVAADISDSWPVGRSVLTAPDAATARTALAAVATTDLRLADARTPLTHTHAISDVTGLQSALNSKFNTPSGATSQYVRGDGSLATLPAGTAFNYGDPVARTLVASTAYQAADPTKAAIIYPSYSCQNATQVLASSACTLQVRIGTAGLTCSTGTVYYTQSLTVGLGLLLTQNSTNPVPIFLPAGRSFAICPQTGTFAITAVEQTAG